MAVHAGSEGTIKIGSNAVAELLSYNLTESIDLIEKTAIADSFRSYTTGKGSWSGEVSTNWDETDSSGQGAMTIGASVTLNVYPEGADSGDTYYQGTAIITSIDRSADAEGLVTATYGVTGTGGLTAATV